MLAGAVPASHSAYASGYLGGAKDDFLAWQAWVSFCPPWTGGGFRAGDRFGTDGVYRDVSRAAAFCQEDNAAGTAAGQDKTTGQYLHRFRRDGRN